MDDRAMSQAITLVIEAAQIFRSRLERQMALLRAALQRVGEAKQAPGEVQAAPDFPEVRLDEALLSGLENRLTESLFRLEEIADCQHSLFRYISELTDVKDRIRRLPQMLRRNSLTQTEEALLQIQRTARRNDELVRRYQAQSAEMFEPVVAYTVLADDFPRIQQGAKELAYSSGVLLGCSAAAVDTAHGHSDLLSGAGPGEASLAARLFGDTYAQPVRRPEPAPVPPSRAEFSAVAPRTLNRGDYSLISVVMYEPSRRDVVEGLLRELDGNAQEKRGGEHEAAKGDRITVRLLSPDIDIEDSEETQTWSGGYLNFSFAVLLPEEYPKRQILFKAEVHINGVIATRLSFIVSCASQAPQRPAIERRDVMSAFMSYASQDRARVAALVQGMKIARKDLQVFFDVESLRSGDDWEKRLYSEIDSRDMLFLCWSRSARDSEWVKREWQYALKRKGLDGIEPVAIELPEVCPPPEELKSKHFSDILLYVIKSSEDAAK